MASGADRPVSLLGLRTTEGVHAALDLGTNSFHLLIARVDEQGGFDVLTREKEMVRLGSGSGDMRNLSQEAIDRGIETLVRFRKVADSFGAEITAVATSALREASNRAEFVARALDEASIEVDVVSGVEEARLIHLGVIQSLAVFDRQILVVDIGGGSTEFLVGLGSDVRSAHSTKLGAIRLTDRFFPRGKVATRAVQDCRTYVRSFLVPTVRRVRKFAPFLAVGSSGTITTVGRVVVGQRGGDTSASVNGIVFTRSELDGAIESILGARKGSERAEIDGLDERRRDIIVAGVLLLEQIMEGLSIDSMMISDAGLREGILLDRAARSGDPAADHLGDIRKQSVRRMADLYHEDLAHIEQATRLALDLFDATQAIHGLGPVSRDLLEAAGMLHNVGLFISHAAHHRHSYYVVRNSDQLNGFTDSEIEIIAQVARYHRKSAPKASHPEFQELSVEHQQMVRVLAGLLRVAIALDRTRQSAVRRLDVSVDEHRLNIGVVVTPGADMSLETYTANQRKRLLSSVLDRDVDISVVGRS